jgi:CRP-like cAMP-binding protein
VREGDINEALFVVVQGLVELSRAGKVLVELGPGEHFGTATLLRGRRALATARAKVPTRVIRIASEPFLSLVRSRPWLGVALLERLGRRLGRDLDRALGGGACLDEGSPSVASALL